MAPFDAKAIEQSVLTQAKLSTPSPLVLNGEGINSQLKLKQGTSFTSIAKATNAIQAPL